MIPLLDTHQHLIYPEVATYSWTNANPILAGKSFKIQDYHTAANGWGIEASLFMETAVDDADIGAETRFVAKLAKNRSNQIAGLIATCRPEIDEGFDQWLEQAGGLGIVGFRRILQNVSDDLSQSTIFRRNVRKIGEKGLPFDLCCRSAQLPIATELARACDNTQFILNHCGNPDILGGQFEDWRKDILTIAELPNVCCKLSGILPRTSGDKTKLETIQPYVAHVIDAFGTQRIVWGSDWPVVNRASRLNVWVAITRSILESMSEPEAQAVAHKNAERLYGIAGR